IVIQQNPISSTTQKSNLSQNEKFHLPLFFPDKFRQLLQEILEKGRNCDSAKPNFIDYSKIKP
ncbi:hypothetical protein ACP6PL_26455, partial [Dapis sp. BLCC M126]|uniref:hypothetical protein n=1 Tax=Dapis sp. BLCC M126 TaxID=3400189 RepID=UPI003CE8F0BE